MAPVREKAREPVQEPVQRLLLLAPVLRKAPVRRKAPAPAPLLLLFLLLYWFLMLMLLDEFAPGGRSVKRATPDDVGSVRCR